MPVAALEIPQTPSVNPASNALHHLLAAAAFSPLDRFGFIRVSGEDRVRWLNGMVTNSIVALSPGQGCYCFLLNAQGRIQGDATVWLFDDYILLQTALDRVPSLIAFLERFIIMDDVALEAVKCISGLLVAGPESVSILNRLGLAPDVSASLAVTSSRFEDLAVDLISAHSPLVPRFEVWAGAETIRRIADALGTLIPQASAVDLEHLRLLEGTPVYGTDIRDRELPQETGQSRALHFSKGCYLGQEIVERIRSRGNVHRAFSGFELTGHRPEAGTSLFASEGDGKSIGELTSVAAIDLPSGQRTLALGYIRREIVDRGSSIAYPGGTAQTASLPFTFSLSPTPRADIS